MLATPKVDSVQNIIYSIDKSYHIERNISNTLKRTIPRYCIERGSYLGTTLKG